MPIEADRDYIKTFILNGQATANELIYSEYYDEGEEPTDGLTL